MAHPERITAIVSQNGNAYEEGLGDAWAPIRRYWNEPTSENREAIRKGMNADGMRHEYGSGISDTNLIKPEGYTLDAALLARPGNVDIQLDLFLNYADNVKLYPAFHEYFRKYSPPLLAIWGKNDPTSSPRAPKPSFATTQTPPSSFSKPGILHSKPISTKSLSQCGNFWLER